MHLRRLHVFLMAWLTILMAGTLAWADSAPATQPALRPGTALPAAFEPINVTGEFAGRRHCLVCENGLNPVVMIFARNPSVPLESLLVKLEAAIAKDTSGKLGSFAVFLSEDEKLEEQLTKLAEKRALKQVILSMEAPGGPEGYPITPETDVLVVLYTKHTVNTVHTFEKGQFTEQTVEKVLADLPKILPPGQAK